MTDDKQNTDHDSDEEILDASALTSWSEDSLEPLESPVDGTGELPAERSTDAGFHLDPPQELSEQDSANAAIDAFLDAEPVEPGPERATEETVDTDAPPSQSLVRWKEEPDDYDEEVYEPVKFSPKMDRESEMDMTPMVDVTFLLLIFFMVTASFTIQKTIEQPPQVENEPSLNTTNEDEDDEDYIVVFVDEGGTFNITYGDNDWECPSEQSLIRRLRDIKNDTTSGATPTDMQVLAHAECMHERVVIAVDAGTEVGMAKVSVAMTEEDEL